MKSWRRPPAGLPTLILLAVLVGCGGSTPSGDSGAPEVPSSQETFANPSDEPTGPEPPQPTRDRPAIEIASLPVGGNVNSDGTSQCAEVNWLGTKPIPDGVTVLVSGIGLDPGGVFRLDRGACSSDLGSCVGVRWRGDSLSPCQVGVRQIAAGDGDVQLIVKGTVTCRELADCQNLVQPGNGSQISFSPEDIAPPTEESPPETSTEPPTDGPPDTPTDVPTDSSTDSPTG